MDCGDDAQKLIGLWTVTFKTWVWEYTFAENGTVNWHDVLTH